MTGTETLLLTFAVTIVGSGLGTTIVAALFKKRFDTQLETHKALLLRSGRIHERQVDSGIAAFPHELCDVLNAADLLRWRDRGGESLDRHAQDRLGMRLGLGRSQAVGPRELVELALVELFEDVAAPQRTIEIFNGEAQQEVPLLAGP